MVNAKDLDLVKCECCDNLMDREAYDEHWDDRRRLGEQSERLARFEAALLIVAATGEGTSAHVAKSVLGINKGAQ